MIDFVSNAEHGQAFIFSFLFFFSENPEMEWALLPRFECGCNDDIFAQPKPDSCSVLSNLEELLGPGYRLVVE